MTDEAGPVVWHYTTLNALDAILSSRVLRLTHADYLNDPRERRLVHDQWMDRLRQGYPEIAKRYADDANARRVLHTLAPFSASFSKNPDNLLLWVNYTDQLSGVAIGFNADYLRGLDDGAREADLIHEAVDMVYTVDTASASAQEHYQGFTGVKHSLGREDPHADTLYGWFMDQLLATLAAAGAAYKTPGWEQEEEWRITRRPIVSTPFSGREDVTRKVQRSWKYDARQPGRPFMELKFDPGLAVAEVIVGPCGQIDRVENLLAHHRVQARVAQSPTKHRRG